MPRRSLPCLAAVLLLAICVTARQAGAAEKSAAEILPPTTVVYMEINHPKDLFTLVLDSPLKKKIDQTEQYRKMIGSPQFKEFQTILGVIETRAGAKWRQVLEATTAGGLVLAFDADTQGVILLAKSSNIDTTNSFRDAFFSLAREDAKNKGNPDPIEKLDYHGLTAYKAGDGVIGTAGPWLLLSNKSDLAKSAADLYLEGGACLARDKTFAQAHQAADKTATGWAYVPLKPIRAVAESLPILDPKYKSDNPGAEILVGGLLPIARNADYLAASLTVKPDDLKVSLSAPMNPASIPPEMKFFFAAPGDGIAKPLRPKGTMLSVSMYRDASAMWQAGPDLFTDAIATRMAQAESGLSTFFGGKQFSTDVLGAMKPQIQLVAVKQDFKAAGVSEPALRLPGFALVWQVKPEQFDALRKKLRTGFQTVIAFTNVDGATKGRPALNIETEKRGQADIEFATYDMPDKTSDKRGEGDFYLNFSPALVMSKDCVMLCTTRQIAEQLADLSEKQGSEKPVTIADNTLIELDGTEIAALIKADREQLIAQNMLEKGHDRAAAEREVDVLAMLVNYVQEVKLRLTPGAHDIRLELEVQYGR